MTPEETAFLNEGAAPFLNNPSEASMPKSGSRNQAAIPAGNLAASLKVKSTSPVLDEETAISVHTEMVGLNTRVGRHINAALLRASTDRKIERRSRAAVQDIVNEALTEWLKRAGYIKGS
ncbi:hypothetical protein [Prosthecobacter fusiformis]|uniref:hypothetical protein n=1 Tax=Prosthecobacter fusiformis TaxID=48464 RepID=UPI00105F1E8E|nr:hypothetical protein [Prosthecobacter fusiformis]